MAVKSSGKKVTLLKKQEPVRGGETELPSDSNYARRPYAPTRTTRIPLEVTRPHFIYDIFGYDVRTHGITERWERLLVTNGISQSLIFVELGELGLQIYQFDASPNTDPYPLGPKGKVEATHFLIPPKNVCNFLRLGEMSFERDSLSNFRQRGAGKTNASFLRRMERNNFQQVTFLLYDTEIFTTINFIKWMSDYSLFHTEPHQSYYPEDQLIFRYLESMGLLHLWKKQEDFQKDLEKKLEVKKKLEEQRKLLEENFRSNRETLIHASILEAEKAARAAEKASFDVAQEGLKTAIALSERQIREVAESLRIERERTAKLEAENERLRVAESLRIERERTAKLEAENERLREERKVDGLFVGIGDKADEAVDASMTGEVEIIEGELVESSNRENSSAMVLHQEEQVHPRPRKREFLKNLAVGAVKGARDIAVEVAARGIFSIFKP